MTLPSSLLLQLPTAAVAGFLTFFASCLLPLVPTYIAYLSGVALTSDMVDTRWRLVRISSLFAAGFILTFMVLGVSFATLGSYLATHRLLLERIGGIFFIVIGLFLLGLFQQSWLNREIRIDLGSVSTRLKNWQSLHALAAGIAFAFGWTPCVGPMLALILFWSTHAGSQLHGLLLLAAFGIGLGVPFVGVAVAYEQLLPLLRKSQKTMQLMQKVAGVFVVASGVLMLLGKFHWIAVFLMRWIQLPTISV